MKKRVFAFLLALTMVCSVIFSMPTTAFAAEYTSGEYTYTLSSGQATITKVNSAISGTVEIPSSLGGHTVVAIGSYAFKGISGIQKLTIANTVTSIGYEAFRYCSGLKEVVIPSSVTTIGERAFRDCTSVTKLTIGSGLTAIPSYCFDACTALETVSIGASVTKIGQYAFSGCSALKSITWGESLKSIESSAFGGCTSLTNVAIPDTVTTIGDYAFKSCTGIRDLTIGNSVTSIGYEAFRYCSGLKEIAIPSSVITVEARAFRDCTGITKVYFPESLQTIGNSAFDGCNAIKDVYYESSQSDWEDYVEIGTYNEPITNATFHYNYTYTPTVKDDILPTATMLSTNDVATSQTVNLILSDNVGVAGYYWGTNSSYSSNTYTATSNTFITKKISSAGTYYLVVKDTSGNVSLTSSIVFYKTDLNANGGSVSPSSVLTEKGNTVKLPTPEKSGSTFIGWATSASATGGVASIKPNANATYYAIWVTDEPDVPELLYGDLNADGAVNKKDSLLMKMYLADDTTEIDKGAADVYADGIVNKKDSLYLKQYLAGLDVKLGA